MKKTLIPIALVFALGAVALSGTAMAIDTATVTVSANVVGTCKFSSPTGVVAFGDLTPSTSPSDVIVTPAEPQFWCTKGASYTIGDNKGSHSNGLTFRMQHSTSSSEFIPYTFTYIGTGSGNGPANPISVGITATVRGTDYSGAFAGNYADTVTLTINP